MHKKLICLALGSVFTMPLAVSADSSSVKIFGRVQAEYSSTKIDQAAGAADFRQEVIGDNAGQSRWGLDISEDLGNGLRAKARIEYGFSTGAGVADNAREQWVGLAGKNWGEFKFGRFESPLKNFVGGATIDPFFDSNLQAVGAGGAMYGPNNGLGSSAFIDHAIRYDSPDFNGFSAAVVLLPGDATQTEPNAGGAGGTGGRGGSGDYQVALKYQFSNKNEIFGAYSKDNASDTQRAAFTNDRFGDDETLWRIGGKVTFGDFSLVGQYDDVRNALANGGVICSGGANAGADAGNTTSQCNSSLNANGDGSIWFLGAHYNLGKTTFIVQGGRTKADQVNSAASGVVTAGERSARNVTLGAIYQFSKRTRVFGGYQRVNVDGARAVDNTAATGTTALAIQPKRSTWDIGLRHDF